MKRIRLNYIAVAAALILLGGCVREYPGDVINDQATVTLMLNVPYSANGSTRSIAAAPDANGEGENRIDDIAVLALTERNGEWVFDYKATNVSKQRTGNSLRVTASVFEMTEPQQFVILLNSSAELAAAAPIRYEKITSIEERLVTATGGGEWAANNNGSGVFTPFPMYARTGAHTVGVANNEIGTYNILRMVARVDVNLKAGLDNFVLEEACLFNHKTAGYISYGNSGFDGSKATIPAVPAVGDHTGDPILEPTVFYQSDKTTDSRGELFYSIYPFESPAIVSEGDKTKGTALVVGGYFNGSDELSYYRIDLKTTDDTSANISSGILRNHSYHVEIQSVSGAGYETPKEAYIGGNLLSAKITPWNEAVQSVIADGQFFLKVSEDELFFSSFGDTFDIAAETNYDITTQGYPAGIQVDETEITYDPEVAPGDEWLTLTLSGSDGDLIRDITVTAAQNLGTTPRSAKVNVKAGNMTKVINIEQSIGDFTFDVTGVGATYTYAGGIQIFTVKSYATATFSDGTQSSTEIPWTTEFSTDNGLTWSPTAPGWLIIPESGEGSTTDAPYNAEVLAMEIIYNLNPEDEALREGTPLGTADVPYDLSTKGGSAAMNTANCYIVNAGGHYKLPLVYGNAVTNGLTNSQAYISTQDASTMLLKYFLRHDGQPIEDPYIYNNGLTPADAVLIWMDYPGLVVNVRLTDDNKYLAFDMPRPTVGQGNAIVAVRDASGTIMWSWHIWATPLVNMDAPATDATTNRNSVTRHFMQYNLGWCTGREAVNYGTAPRSVQVRVKQEGTDEVRTFTLKQNNGVGQKTGDNNPYWQWGRKDPMLPSTGIGLNNKIIYGDFPYTSIQGWEAIDASIRSPYIFYTDPSHRNWTDEHLNLWSANNLTRTVNDNVVVKTVYDPSPAGFSIAASGAWTGFTATGGTVNNTAQFNVSGMFHAGWDFLTDNGTAFYPASGRRDGLNGLLFVRTVGAYWTAIPNSSQDHIRNMYMSATQISPMSNIGRATGCSVRCAKE